MKSLIEILKDFCFQFGVLLIVYIATLAMIFLDLWAGCRKAKQRGEFQSSFGLRKTGDKIARYFNVLMLMTVIDFIQMLFFYHLNQQITMHIPVVPVVTVIMATFFGIIEFKSIYETSEEKDKAKFQDAAKLAKDVLANKDTQSVIAAIFSYLKSQEKDSKYNGN